MGHKRHAPPPSPCQLLAILHAMRNGVHPEEISRRTTYSTSSIFRWRAKFHKELEFFQRLERLDPEFCASYTLDAFYPDLNRQPQLLFLEEPEPPRHHLADFL